MQVNSQQGLEGARVVCIGETMAQVIPYGRGRLESSATFSIVHAGAESNVAISLARLGTRSAWAGRVGGDPLGVRVLREIQTFGVETDLAEIDPSGRTGVFFKDPEPTGSRVDYYRENSSASRMTYEFVQGVLSETPRWLHLTGVTSALSNSCRKAVSGGLTEAGRRGIPTSFDVNYRPVLWESRDLAAQVLADTANQAEVVFVGLDEAHTLWGTETSADVRHVLDKPRVLIVKDGGVDATAFIGDQTYCCTALVVEVADPVGAGDAFAAGWLHALLNGLDPMACLRLGHLVAGAALASTTDFGNLPDVPASLLLRATSGTDWVELQAQSPNDDRQDGPHVPVA